VIHLRGTYQAKNESWSFLKNALNLVVEGVTTKNMFFGLEEDTELRIELADCDLAAHEIPLAENLTQIPFHEMTETIPHHPSSISEHFEFAAAKTVVIWA
jgi:hypothetical protein